MQTLRRKNSPCKFKNEPTRFLGEGVSFKAKLIGILEVSEARGDRMCQAALADLKMAIRAAGEHKQRITVQISIDGLRLRDEKTGDCQYHHPVHKISFIAQDMSDSRAFGYIFGSPDMGHRFFGIKTDKAASQVVIAMRDLFQVVFELKKKEIELAKQHIEQTTIKFHSSGIFVEPSPDTKGAAGSETSHHRTISEVEKSIGRKHETQSGVVADLLDLQFELNSLQQGIRQMDKITPDNPRPTEDPFDADPFGDSFANMKVKENVQPILPPPPSSRRNHLDRQPTVQATSTSSSSSPITTVAGKSPPPYGSTHWFDKETEDLFTDGELSNLSRNLSGEKDKDSDSSTPRSYYKTQQVDVFTELDPLGTGLIKPYVDKKDFFQHLKNPPKKVLKDLATTCSSDTFPADFKMSNISDPIEPTKVQNTNSDSYEDNSFANFEKFNDDDSPRTSSPLLKKETSSRNNYQSLSVSLPPEEERQKNSSSTSNTSILTKMDRDSTESTQGLIKLPSPRKYLQYSRKDYGMDNRTQSIDKSFPIDFSGASDSPGSPLKSCSSETTSRLSNSSVEMDNVPEPPPRGSGSILINPPPLPPKKQSSRGSIKPPPRPPYSEGHFHYDFLEREEGSPSPTRRERNRSPAKDVKGSFDDNFSPPMPQLPKKSEVLSDSSFEDSFSSIIPPSLSTLFQNSSKESNVEVKKPKPSLYITLSQLTSSNLSELANSLNMTVEELTSLTLQQLTECLAELCAKEAKAGQKASTPVAEQVPSKGQAKMVETAFVSNEPMFKADFDQGPKKSVRTYDKYAVFRELLETERSDSGKNDNDSIEMEVQEETRPPEEEDEEIEENNKSDNIVSLKNLTVKLPPVGASLFKGEHTPEEEMCSELPETKIESIMTDLREDKDEEKKLSRDSSKDSEEGTEQEDQAEENEDVIKKSQSETSDKESSSNETENMPEKVEIKQSTSTSSDRYAALREIMDATEQSPLDIESESTNYITSPLRASPIRTSPLKTSPMKTSPVKTKPSAEVDLMSLFSDTPPPLPAKTSIKKDTKAVMDIFEEIKMLNVETPTTINKPITGFEDVFCPLAESKSEKEENKEEENWAKFDTNVFQSDKPYGDNHGSVGGTSPWSPDGKEFYKEPPPRTGIQRHSGESDNEWKDEEESEESNGRYKGEAVPYGRPPYGMTFEERTYYEENMETGDKERSFRDKMGKKTRGVPWGKPGHRPRDPPPWHEDSRWEEERKRYLHRKVPYKDEEEYKAYWKCRPKQRPWNGDREGFWPHDDPYYEEERNKRRLMLWNDERESRDRFSSQESMGYEDEERWTRREYERRRWEEDGTFWNRRGPDGEYPHKEMFRKHDPHYGRDARHYDYPPAWEEEYAPERTDDSPRYASRKRHWPKRPNSANEGRNQEVYCGGPMYSMSRSECSDNDSDPYHRPHRSRSRDSYWGSDQEFDSWGERPYWSEGADAKNDSFHKRRMNRHRTRIQTKSQSSPFEDDFTQPMERNEVSVDSLSAEPRTRVDVELKKSPSPRSIKEHGKREPRSYKSSSYFEDDLTPTASASSDASDRPRLGSDLKATPEEMPADIKDPDSFVSEDSGRDSFFNGDQRFDDDAFTFRSELEDQVPEKSTLKNSRSNKYANNKLKSDQYIKKSESVNIFARENDPFDDDEFFN